MEVSWHVVAPSHQPGRTTAATKAAG
jgi:hypothetical protein